MRPAKASAFRLSTMVAGVTVVILLLYCVYILPMAFRSSTTDTSIDKLKAYTGNIREYKPAKEGIQPASTVPETQAIRPTAKQTNPPPPPSPVVSEPDATRASTDIQSARQVDTQEVVTYPTFPPPITVSTPNAAQHPAVMVVGGTDGSGTRRVVQILAELGVVMVSEDPETYDIHADLVKGWPEVVTPVVTAARSLDYTPSKMNTALQEKTRKNVGAILGQVAKDSIKPQSFKLAVGGVLPHPEGVQATAVKYGFKAPVAMTLTPWFAELSPHFKMVHVLRDGRDISFSANQGPVTKFFTAMYGMQHARLHAAVKGIKLWSDWNSQVHTWAQRYAQQLSSMADAKDDRSFGYFAIHSEDLVHPSSAVRYAAIKHLAGFVGSTLTPQQLCCMALKESGFMGSHDRTPINKRAQAAATVTKRYGKWHAQLDKNPALSEEVHREGAAGLRTFGYEPPRALATENMRGAEGDYCAAEVHGKDCKLEEAQKDAVDAKAYGVQGMCTTEAGIDFIGGDIDAVPVVHQDRDSCCRKCKSRPDCAFFVVDTLGDICYLKSRNTGTKLKDSLVAGTIVK